MLASAKPLISSFCALIGSPLGSGSCPVSFRLQAPSANTINAETKNARIQRMRAFACDVDSICISLPRMYWQYRTQIRLVWGQAFYNFALRVRELLLPPPLKKGD